MAESIFTAITGTKGFNAGKARNCGDKDNERQLRRICINHVA
jgi:hypothetical protein